MQVGHLRAEKDEAQSIDGVSQRRKPERKNSLHVIIT